MSVVIIPDDLLSEMSYRLNTQVKYGLIHRSSRTMLLLVSDKKTVNKEQLEYFKNNLNAKIFMFTNSEEIKEVIERFAVKEEEDIDDKAGEEEKDDTETNSYTYDSTSDMTVVSLRELINNANAGVYKTIGFLRKIGDKFFVIDNDSVVEVSPNESFVNKHSIQANTNAEIIGYYVPDDVKIVATEIKSEPKETDPDFVDLHVYTKHTAFGSVIDIEEYAQRVKELGRKYIAVTDRDGVHAFPKLEQVAKTYDLKPIYGVELSTAEYDTTKPINAKSNFRLSSAEYVVLDLETTGTSKKFDEIVEIGAVKLRNGVIVDKFHTLVKPKGKMSALSSQITNISDEELANAPSIEEIWPKFKQFIGNAVLVAHNADFDIGFLKAYDKTIDNDWVDTLRLARMLLDLKRFNLKALANHFKIGQFEHHRAGADAEVLAQIFVKLLGVAYERGYYYVEDILMAYKPTVSLNDLYYVTIFVKNQEGLRNLYRILSKAQTQNLEETNRVVAYWSDIEANRDGLLIGTGMPDSELFIAVNENADDDTLASIIAKYDFVELTHPNVYHDKNVMLHTTKELYRLAKHYGKLVIATTGARCLYDTDVHGLYAVVQSKRAKSKEYSFTKPVMHTSNTLYTYFSTIIGKDEANEIIYVNPVKIAEQIESVTIIKSKLETPGIEDSDKKLVEHVTKRLHEVYGDKPHDIVIERFNKELDSLLKYGFADLYMLAKIVVDNSVENGYEVGSRGSVGSSFIAWLLGITEINPLPAHYVCPVCKRIEFTDYDTGADMPHKKCPDCHADMNRYGFNIPFETFVGFEGDKVPDIDLNIADEYQDKSHEFVRQLFGTERVIRAGTIATISERTKYAIADEYIKANDIKGNAKEYVAKLVDGVKTGTGQHPGGLLIVPKSKTVDEITPVQYPADDPTEPITSHFEYDYLHDWIVKLDLLGHQTPTILKHLYELTGIDPRTVDYSDPKVLKLFYSSDVDLSPITTVDTIGVPEFNTSFVRGVLEQTRPQTVDELIRISGLTHGTGNWFDNADRLIMSGTATLKDVACARDDIMLTLIKYGGDRKWAFEVMERVRKGKGLRDSDIAIMHELDVPEWYIQSLQKIVYMFPKAHAAAYTVMSLRIAWFKVYQPLAFYCAVLSKKNDITHEYYFKTKEELSKTIYDLQQEKTPQAKQKIQDLELIFDAIAHGVKFYKPHVLYSDATRFLPYKDGIILPLTSVDGIGESVANQIVLERNIRRFETKEDVIDRAGLNKTQVSVLETIGAFDSLLSRQVSLFDFVS